MTQLLIIFERDGHEIERRGARDGHHASLVLMALVADIGVLQPGDRMIVEED